MIATAGFEPRVRTCRVCEDVRLVHDFSKRNKDGVPLRWERCLHCGFTFMNPRLRHDDVLRIYNTDTYWNDGAYRDYLSNEDQRLADAEKRLSMCKPFLRRGGAWLDIGCATGFFLATASKHGFHGIGLDPAATMIDYGRRTYGLDLRCQTMESAELPANSFDVVSLWGTDSHFYDARAAFERIAGWLKPGGHFLFSYQDYSHWIRRVFPGLKRHAHLYYNFSRRSLHTLLAQVGFRVRLERTIVQPVTLYRIASQLFPELPLPRATDRLRVNVPTLSFKTVIAERCA